MAKGHKKNTKVKFKNSNKSISEAKAEGFNISTDWQESPLMTKAQAVRYYNDLKDMGYDVEFVITHLFEAMKKKIEK